MNRSHRVKLFTVIVFLAIVVELSAQNQAIKFEQLPAGKIGLSHSHVKCILQDSRGFLWIGTEGGLNRYDGYGFKTYFHSEDDPLSLSDDAVECLYEDTNGEFWVGALKGGLNRYDRATETFIHYRHDPADPHSLADGQVLTIYEERDNSGKLWIGASTGLCRMTRDEAGNARFVRYQHESGNSNSLSQDYVFAIAQDSAGAFWIGTYNGLNRFDPDTETFTRYKHNPWDPNSLGDKVVWSIAVDGDSLLWLGTFGGLDKFNLKTGTFHHYRHDSAAPLGLSHSDIFAIHQDESGILWLGTRDGLNRFDPSTEIFTSFRHDPDDPNSLSGNWIYSMHKDRSGVLWLGSIGSGVNKVNPRNKNFNHYKHKKNDPSTLDDNLVWSIHEDQTGRLWVGTHSGLNIFGKDRKTVTHYQHDPQQSNSLSSHEVYSILADRSGRYWVGASKRLNRFLPETGEFVHYLHNPGNRNSLSNWVILALHEDHGGALWVGTYKGLNKLVLATDEETGQERVTITRYYPDPKGAGKPKECFINTIHEDRRNILWIGTKEGLARFDQAAETFTYYREDANDPNSLSNDIVWSVYEDRSGALWIGTAGGLDKLDRKTRKFKHYSELLGMSGWVAGILEDGRGNLWFTSPRGLSKFNPTTEIIRTYDTSDGLQGGEFMTSAYYKSASPRGEMFYGGKNGFNAFFPDEIQDNAQAPPVVFTDFKMLNQSVPVRRESSANPDAAQSPLRKSITETEELILSYRDDLLSFEFAALDFVAPGKNQYAYKLEGIHDEWIHLGHQRSVTFANLAPGDYSLWVKGSNNDGIWNEEGASVRIIITPPWWRTNFAYACYLVMFAAVLYGLRRIEVNRGKLRNELRMKNFEARKLQEVDQMKSHFFANISHEFRTPLTLILGPIETWLTKKTPPDLKKDLHMMQRNGKRLLRLINQLLDLSKLEANKMTVVVAPENLTRLLRGIVQSFASWAERKAITLQFEAPDEDIRAYIDRDKVENIFNNLLSNALKFTPEQETVSVSVRPSSFDTPSTETGDSGSVEISVKDTGPGIPADRLERIFDRFYQADSSHEREYEGTGIGLALTRELVECHHGEIEVTSEPGVGTTFTVSLPLGKSHFKDDEIVELPVEPRKGIEELVEDDSTQPCEGFKPSQGLTEDSEVLLFVEDNTDVRQYMRGHLEQDYQIIEAVNGEDGLEKALEHVPDLIISDVMMPKMDGFALCEKLKTDEKTSHIPVILLTARASDESKVEGLETGADDYLTKPFDANELKVRIKNLIEQRRKLRERFGREITLQPRDVVVTSMDEKFLRRAMDIVEEHIPDSEFTVEKFARQAGMSHMQLHRKLKALTEQSANGFIRTLRLQRAAQLLQKKSGNVSEIAYEVGFNNLSYFADCFRKQFGLLPSEYGHRQTQAPDR